MTSIPHTITSSNIVADETQGREPGVVSSRVYDRVMDFCVKRTPALRAVLPDVDESQIVCRASRAAWFLLEDDGGDDDVDDPDALEIAVMTLACKTDVWGCGAMIWRWLTMGDRLLCKRVTTWEMRILGKGYGCILPTPAEMTAGVTIVEGGRERLSMAVIASMSDSCFLSYIGRGGGGRASIERAVAAACIDAATGNSSFCEAAGMLKEALSDGPCLVAGQEAATPRGVKLQRTKMYQAGYAVSDGQTEWKMERRFTRAAGSRAARAAGGGRFGITAQ